MLRSHPMRGASLIELLVALVVASLGLLAMAALQAASARYTHVSQRRAVATLLAGDIAERMRVNVIAAGDLVHYEFSQAFSVQNARRPLPPAVLCEGASATCSVGDMAAYDLATWRQSVRDLLPEGAVITRSLANSSQLGIWIAWRDPDLHEASASGPRAAGECHADFILDITTDATVRCLSWQVPR